MSDFCEICGVLEADHPPAPPPGPPTPPPERHEGVWRAPHEFRACPYPISELLDERDAQIRVWRARALNAERQLGTIHNLSGGPR